MARLVKVLFNQTAAGAFPYTKLKITHADNAPDGLQAACK